MSGSSSPAAQPESNRAQTKEAARTAANALRASRSMKRVLSGRYHIPFAGLPCQVNVKPPELAAKLEVSAIKDRKADAPTGLSFGLFRAGLSSGESGFLTRWPGRSFWSVVHSEVPDHLPVVPG